MRRAQGTIEYLVILAVIIIVSLVVVSLMINSTAPAAGISSATSQISSVSNPIAIVDSVVSEDGNYFLKFRNQTGENVEIKTIQVGDEITQSLNKKMSLNSEEAFVISTGDVCVEGQLVANEIVVIYLTDLGLEKRQTYAVPINFQCTTYESKISYTDETGETQQPGGANLPVRLDNFIMGMCVLNVQLK
jgi:hypothetical protein